MPRYELVPTPFDDLRTNTSASQVSTEIDISTQLHRWLDVKDDEKQNRYQPCADDLLSACIFTLSSVLLTRSSHISYLYPLFFNLAGHFACLDSSRAWIIYWYAITFFSFLSPSSTEPFLLFLFDVVGLLGRSPY
ncbi:uncharacterized protein VP01_3165g1 [Puccinia sorghi]|uniref:Uncharacterized protein n=1 Tax=Puccinia sorghi TaxID=27349 RepID=A0A0L6UYX9_9BASI|nr:uncharacterized protein VP01_3165g1 [Puccinia sorghi]